MASELGNSGTSSYRLQDAAVVAGRSRKTLVRWCRNGLLPNAVKVPGPKGLEWSIPAADLYQVMEAKGLVSGQMDVRAPTHEQSGQTSVNASTKQERTAEVSEEKPPGGDRPLGGHPGHGGTSVANKVGGGTHGVWLVDVLSRVSRQQEEILLCVKELKADLGARTDTATGRQEMEQIRARVRQLEVALSKLRSEGAKDVGRPVPEPPLSRADLSRAQRARRIADRQPKRLSPDV